MKNIFLISFLSIVFTSCGQGTTMGYWVPLKRLDHIATFNSDSCSEENEYPFKKIKFINERKVSLFGFYSADPFVYKISELGEKNTWQVQDSLIAALDSTLYKGSKITLKIKNDTLLVDVKKNGNILSQKFVRKYRNTWLKEYQESEIGNIFMSGKFILNKDSNVIEFLENGKIESRFKEEQGSWWSYSKYRFKNYSRECDSDHTPNRIIELITEKNLKQLYLLKQRNQVLEFHKITKMKDQWSPAEYSFAFRLTRTR